MTDLCQCLTIASVESMSVPSKSQRMPANKWVSSGPVNSLSSVSEGMLKELVFVISSNARRTMKPNQLIS